MSTFDGATLLITGGTGSFGSTVLKHFLSTDIGQIRIFSRDEKKQDDMRHELQAKYPDYANKVKFYIGDVRDLRSVADAMPGVDYVWHASFFRCRLLKPMLKERTTFFMRRLMRVLRM
jgi:UDP-glucose 4-epimerase